MFSDLLNKFFNKQNLLFSIVFILFLWFVCKNPDIAFTFFISIVFACSLAPIVNRLSKKMNKPLATILVLTATILIIALLVIPILVMGAYQISAFTNEFPKYISSLNDVINKIPFLQDVSSQKLDLGVFITTFANSSSGIITRIVTFIEGISSAFLYIFTSIIFIFFLIVDEKKIKKGALRLFPKPMRRKVSVIIDNIAIKISGYIFAQTVVCGSVWIIMTLGLLVFRIKYAIILGAIAGIMAIIPVVGSAISLIICLISTYQCGIQTLIIVTILFTVSHFIENHIVRPYVYSKFLNLHQIIIFLALFIGAKYGGVIGVLFAPPVAMAMYIILDELYIKNIEK